MADDRPERWRYVKMVAKGRGKYIEAAMLLMSHRPKLFSPGVLIISLFRWQIQPEMSGPQCAFKTLDHRIP